MHVMELVSGLQMGCILILILLMEYSFYRYFNSVGQDLNYLYREQRSLRRDLNRLRRHLDRLKKRLEEQGRMEDLHDEDSDLVT